MAIIALFMNIPRTFVTKDWIHNETTIVQLMAWRQAIAWTSDDSYMRQLALIS